MTLPTIQRDRRLGWAFFGILGLVPAAGVVCPVCPELGALILTVTMVLLPCIIAAVIIDQWREKEEGPRGRGACGKKVWRGTGVQSTPSSPAGARPTTIESRHRSCL